VACSRHGAALAAAAAAAARIDAGIVAKGIKQKQNRKRKNALAYRENGVKEPRQLAAHQRRLAKRHHQRSWQQRIAGMAAAISAAPRRIAAHSRCALLNLSRVHAWMARRKTLRGSAPRAARAA